jgi:tetratricopeptide (TPR) repeat protein
MRLDEYEYAKEQYENLLKLDADDDSAHASLANALEKLGDTTMAIIHHKKSIELDSEYAPHYYNYANTLYESGDTDGALENYTKAYELDSSLDAAKDMIKKIEG